MYTLVLVYTLKYILIYTDIYSDFRPFFARPHNRLMDWGQFLRLISPENLSDLF